MSAYYNEFDPYAAEWLRNLIAAGHIAPGDVDERSIEDVRGEDLRGYDQVHLFAGIGGWSLALRMAGWPDDQPVWTGSCPCQPFSVAGRGRGTTDARHLWPEMRRLIAECKPEVVFGEQVASAEVVGTQLEAAFVVAVQAGDCARANRLAHRLARSKSLHYWRRWVDGVSTDLAELGYSWGHAVCGAHSVGAPHIRQRLWWCAERLADPAGAGGASRVQASGTERATGPGQAGARGGLADSPCGRQREHGCAPGQPGHADQRGASERLADAELRERGQGRLCDGGGPAGADGERAPEELAGSGGRGGLVYPERDGRGPDQQGRGQDRRAATRGAGAGGGLGDAGNEGLEGRAGQRGDDGAQLATAERAGGHWGNTWLQCSDGTARRVEPSVPPLAYGLPRSVGDLRAGAPELGDSAGSALKDAKRFRKGDLRGAGNAIVPQVAALFIQAYREAAT